MWWLRGLAPLGGAQACIFFSFLFMRENTRYSRGGCFGPVVGAAATRLPPSGWHRVHNPCYLGVRPLSTARVPRLVRVGPGRLVVAVALLLLLIVARRVAAALAPRPEDSDVPVSQRLRGSEPLRTVRPARLLPVAAAAFKFRGSGSRACFMAA